MILILHEPKRIKNNICWLRNAFLKTSIFCKIDYMFTLWYFSICIIYYIIIIYTFFYINSVIVILPPFIMLL